MNRFALQRHVHFVSIHNWALAGILHLVLHLCETQIRKMHPGARALRAAVESRRNSNFGRTVPLKLVVGLRWPRRRLMCHRQVIYDPSAAEKVTHDFFSRRLNKGGLAQSVFVQEAGSAAPPPTTAIFPLIISHLVIFN